MANHTTNITVQNKIISYLKKNSWDFSPLINDAFLIAIDNKDIESVHYFLKQGASISYDKYAALDRVLHYENLPILKLFVEQNSPDFNLSFKDHLILKHSVDCENIDMFEYVLDNMVDIQLDCMSDTYANFWIRIFHRLDFLLAVLKHQTLFGNIVFQNNFLIKYLHFSSPQVLDYFISTGYDINGNESKDHWENSLFLRACNCSNFNLVEHICTHFKIQFQHLNSFSNNAFDIVFQKACEYGENNEFLNIVLSEEVHFSNRENFKKCIDIMVLLIEHGFSLDNFQTKNDEEYHILTYVRSASLKKQLDKNLITLITQDDKKIKL